jgi:hypothetical protein
MANFGDNSNNPFQKGDPFKNNNYNKLFLQFSLAVVVLLLLGLFLVYLSAAPHI